VTARRSPTVRRRRLAIELRRLRTAAGLSLEDAGAHIERTAATISRIENAQVGIRAREVGALLDLYDVGKDDPMRETLLTMAREARQKGWWHPFGDVLPSWFQVYVGLEAAASSIWMYQLHLISGLLQTEDYARAVLSSGGQFTTTAEVERHVAVRMARQAILTGDNPTKLWTVIDESVLRRQVGDPEVMRAQLERLAEEAVRPNITLQVLPLTAGSIQVPGSFSLLKFPEDPSDPPIVYLEHLGGSLYLDKAEDADRYGVAVGHLQAAALSPQDSAELIVALTKEVQ
jgi:transcriptional regulator with XRE-family HTH domain